MQEIVFSVRYVSYLSHAKLFMWADSEIGCLELPYGYAFLSIEYRRYNVLAGKMPDCPEPRLRVRGAPARAERQLAAMVAVLGRPSGAAAAGGCAGCA